GYSVARAPGLVIENTMVLCVGLNSTDIPCSPGPGSTLKVPLGNGTAMLRPEAENTRADLADGPPGSESGSPYLCRLPRSASWRRARSFVCSRPQSTQNQMIPRPASYVLSAALLAILDGRLSMREIPSQSREALEVRFIPLASTCPVAWRCLMRHVSLHPSSFALPPGLRPRSNGHRRMPRQNRLRPSPHSLRKICRRAMGEAGGESFDHLVGTQQERFRDGQPEGLRRLEVDDQLELFR